MIVVLSGFRRIFVRSLLTCSARRMRINLRSYENFTMLLFLIHFALTVDDFLVPKFYLFPYVLSSFGDIVQTS